MFSLSDTYATEEKWWAANSMSKIVNQVDELKSKSSRAICRQISAVNVSPRKAIKAI